MEIAITTGMTVPDTPNSFNTTTMTTSRTSRGDTMNGDASPFVQVTGVMMNGNGNSLINTYVSYTVQSSFLFISFFVVVRSLFFYQIDQYFYCVRKPKFWF